MKRSGILITFEGGEGAGKSTQIRNLVQWLKRQKLQVLVTLQPGGTEIGRKIRELLLSPSIKNLSERAELLLYVADRAQHLEEVVLPALKEGKIVVSDRFSDSSTVYQGICRKLGIAWAEKLNDFATQGVRPDLTFVLDIPAQEGLQRVRNRVATDIKLKGRRRAVKMDRLEREKISFHERVRSGFLLLARRHPKRFSVIDASQTAEEISIEIQRVILKKFKTLRRKSA